MKDKDLRELRVWLKDNGVRRTYGSDRGLIKLIKKDGTEISFSNNIGGDGPGLIWIVEKWNYNECPLYINSEIEKEYIDIFRFKGNDWGLSRYDCSTKDDKRTYIFKDKNAEYVVYVNRNDLYKPIIIMKW